MRARLRVAAFFGLLTTLAVATTTGVARADEAQSTRDARALELFEKSEAAYEAGRFQEAIALLRQSYDLKPEGVLLYNMGRAYEGLGELAAAASAYERFLRAQPEAPDRGALERRIATLRRQIEERAALEQQAREREARASRPSAVPWIVAGVGALGVGAGAVFGAMSRGRHDAANAEPTYVEADRLQRQAETFATTANVCFVAGGIIAAFGVVWGIVDLSTAKGSRTSTSQSVGISF